MGLTQNVFPILINPNHSDHRIHSVWFGLKIRFRSIRVGIHVSLVRSNKLPIQKLIFLVILVGSTGNISKWLENSILSLLFCIYPGKCT